MKTKAIPLLEVCCPLDWHRVGQIGLALTYGKFPTQQRGGREKSLERIQGVCTVCLAIH